MKLNEAIAKRLKQILTQRSWTAYKVAKLGGIPKQIIYSILKSEYKRVSIDILFQIAATLGMTLEEFFADPVFNEVTD